MKQKTSELGTMLIVIAGNIIYALAVKLFVMPADLITGGSTGIALFVNRIWHIPVSPFLLIFNTIMLVWGWKTLGKKFAMTTILSTFSYPLALSFFEVVLKDVVLTENTMLNAVFAGLGIGLSLGLVIRSGASTGGMDIPPLVLNHYFRIPVSFSLNAMDLCILLLQAFFHTPEKTLYGIIVVLIYTMTMDKLLLMGTTRTEVKVISAHSAEIRQAILSEVDRGVTILEAKGGYSGEHEEMLLSIISDRELPKVEKLIHAIDPESFLIVSRVTEVAGRGFTLSKQYKNRT
ncbi:YitT family protein [Stecheria intestinalis]|uniref:YitT family protein n=1 Tax=Stecheria intestinalis TaxID=2606630 RepID=UPI0023F0BCD4|nr:YitT family protein [Stecheria intestinalis]MCI6745219.1 YitT family protein [Anaerolactibacter massiliensis]MDD5882426.1 YitT family protein [Stecheria intestinalis]